MTTDIFCPKCSSYQINIERVTPKPTHPISMDELVNGISRAVPAVLRQHRMKATCLNCGYVVEFVQDGE